MTRTPQALRVGRLDPDDEEGWTAAMAGTLEDELSMAATSYDPLVAYLRRLNVRNGEIDEALRLYNQQMQAVRRQAAHDSAPGNPGPEPVKPQPAPGFWTSEFSVTALSIAVIAIICGGMIYGTTQIESLQGEAKAIVYALVSAVATWALKNLGINYSDNRTRLKAGAQ